MFSKILDFLDKPHKDDVYLYLEKNEKFRKTKEWYGLTLLCIIAMLFILFLFFVKSYSYKPPAIYQVSEKTLANGEYNKQLIALNKPRVTHDALTTWTIRAVNTFYTFDFNNFDRQLANAKMYFTPSAYKAFVTSIEAVKLKEKIVDNKQIISLTVTERPQILTAITDRNGEQAWQLEVPAVIQTTAGTTTYESYIVNLIVRLQTNSNNPSGLYIAEMSMKPSSGVK